MKFDLSDSAQYAKFQLLMYGWANKGISVEVRQVDGIVIVDQLTMGVEVPSNEASCSSLSSD